VAAPDPGTWQWTGNRYRYTGGTQLGGRRHTVYVSQRMVVQFEMDRRGIARVAVGQPLRDAVHSLIVQKAMPYAISISPHGETLEYVSSWRAIDTFEVIAGMRRAACRLFNGSGHAAAVEWGRGGNQRILGRTLAYLNSTSPLGLEQAAKKAARAPWNPQLHPRGGGGRFTASAGAAALRRRAAAATRMRQSQ
jgi:hypothetical protein